MMRTLATLCLLLATAAHGQAPIALRTSDPKFAPRWSEVPAPAPLAYGSRANSYYDLTRPAGTYEIAYSLVMDDGKMTPMSPPARLTAQCREWEVIVRTPGLAAWTRAAGTMWWFRRAEAISGTAILWGQWKPMGQNHPHNVTRPYYPLVGWDHTLRGYKLGGSQNWPGWADPFWKLDAALPGPVFAPDARLAEVPNVAYEACVTWACNDGESPAAPVVSVPAFVHPIPEYAPPDMNCPFTIYRTNTPPQGALGAYLYLRRPGGPWHRQPSPHDVSDHLWPLYVNRMPVLDFRETNVAPDFSKPGRSYLSSLHLAMGHWNRDVIVDSDQQICCPVISEWSGQTWVYDARDHWESFLLGGWPQSPGWKLTVDGVTTAPLSPMVNGTAEVRMAVWNAWQAELDRCFGAGNVVLSQEWGVDGPRFTFRGKYAARDMTGRYAFNFTGLWAPNVNDGSQPLKDEDGVPLPYVVTRIGGQVGQEFFFSESRGNQKFWRTITAASGGRWTLTDCPCPNGAPSGPTGWPLWVENSINTRLNGCNMTLNRSAVGLAFIDHFAGAAFHFRSQGLNINGGGSQPYTYGILCTGTSHGPTNDHVASEPVFKDSQINAYFPVVVEGQQAANWQFDVATLVGGGRADSAILTQTNAGNVTFRNRLTTDNARCLVAAVWASSVKIDALWLDQGMPSLLVVGSNMCPRVTVNGTKINQWANWMHVAEEPAGHLAGGKIKLTFTELESQTNGPVDAMTFCPRAGAVQSTGHLDVFALMGLREAWTPAP
jgi:hypothetical protein